MAGEVVEVGQGVNKFKVGDKVVANTGHAVSAHSNTKFFLYKYIYILPLK